MCLTIGMTSPALSTSKPRLVLSLCFAVAVIEGFDLQAAGAAAPLLVPAMRLAPQQLGLFFAAATFGLIAAALAGGRVPDTCGRRAGLMAALVTFGLFSVATGFARNFETLFAMRLLTGGRAGRGAPQPSCDRGGGSATPGGRLHGWRRCLPACPPAGRWLH